MAFADTSLSIVGILTYQSSVLGIATDGVLPQVIGIASDTLQKWKAPAEYIDNVLVGILSSINLKKQQIVNICASASTGNPTTCGLSTTAAGVTAVYASVTNGTVAVGIATDFGNNVGLASTAIVGYGVMNADTLVAYRYPKLESGDFATDNPIENGANVSITSSNIGIGKENTFTQNDGTNLGYVFAITGGGGSCAGWASSITSLINEIATLRTGITSYVNAVNTVKLYKNSAQLEYWSYNRVVNDSNSIISGNDSALVILSNPAYGGPY
jgi:hypothetical protein